MTLDINAYREKFIALLHSNKTLALATLNKHNDPEASLTPYIYYQQTLWVFVSELSAHTGNLLTHKKASVLLHDAQTGNVFASTRATIACSVSVETVDKDMILDEMTQQLGDTVAMLRQLPDFHLLKLQPVSGRFIAGFGQAFEVDFPEAKLTHIDMS